FLAVRRAAARIGVQHDVALRRHPVELVGEGVTERGVGPTVDLEDERILPRGLEVRWLENPSLDALAVEARIPDLLGRREVEGAEQRVVYSRDLAKCGRREVGGGLDHEQVADVDG